MVSLPAAELGTEEGPRGRAGAPRPCCLQAGHRYEGSGGWGAEGARYKCNFGAAGTVPGGDTGLPVGQPASHGPGFTKARKRQLQTPDLSQAQFGFHEWGGGGGPGKNAGLG